MQDDRYSRVQREDIDMSGGKGEIEGEGEGEGEGESYQNACVANCEL
jgi:hypothetical protein